MGCCGFGAGGGGCDDVVRVKRAVRRSRRLVRTDVMAWD